MKQAGKLEIDIMLVPNADWKAITPMHTHIGVSRAVENGYSLVRPNVNGLSIITDPLGRVIAAMDHDKSSEWVLIAQVPTRGTRTILFNHRRSLWLGCFSNILRVGFVCITP